MRSFVRAFFAGILLMAGTAAAAGFYTPRPGLVTGGQPDAAKLREFKAAGGTLVIDLRGAGEDRGFDERRYAQEIGLDYVSIPVAGEADLTPANAKALHDALTTHKGEAMVHCASGNRVGALFALAMVQEHGKSPEEALEFGKRAGLTKLEPVVRAKLGLPPKP